MKVVYCLWWHAVAIEHDTYVPELWTVAIIIVYHVSSWPVVLKLVQKLCEIRDQAKCFESLALLQIINMYGIFGVSWMTMYRVICIAQYLSICLHRNRCILSHLWLSTYHYSLPNVHSCRRFLLSSTNLKNGDVVKGKNMYYTSKPPNMLQKF